MRVINDFIISKLIQKLNKNDLLNLANKNCLNEVFDYCYIGKGQLATEQTAVGEFCDCPICQSVDGTPQVSRAYLHHLFKIGDGRHYAWPAYIICVVYAQIMEILKKESYPINLFFEAF
jgi:queuine/archaeosine tRNA-ribosyltransferase